MAGVKVYTDLHCWQLANALKVGVYALIKTGDAAKDFEFRDQIRNAAASAPRNIAEGFGRYQPRQIRQYLLVANGSLMETVNHLQDGVDRGVLPSVRDRSPAHAGEACVRGHNSVDPISEDSPRT